MRVVLTADRAVVSTLVGGVSDTTGSYSDASGTNAGIHFPFGVAVDASGNLFVVEQVNQRIRKVTPGGGTPIHHLTLHSACSLCGH